MKCEAAIYATRLFVTSQGNERSIVVKLDIKNAFNSIERDVTSILTEAKDLIPSVYPFLYQLDVYVNLLFCSLRCEFILLNVGIYINDFIIGSIEK